MTTLVLWLVVAILVLILVLAAVDRWGERQRRPMRCAGCGAEIDPAWKAMVFSDGLFCSSECWWKGEPFINHEFRKDRDARPDA